MKRSNLSKVVGAGVLSLSLALVPLTLPSYAQSSTGTGTSSGTGSNPSAVDNTNRQGTDSTQNDRGFDWGWLGLLGLIGLAGLGGRKRAEEPTRYREPDEVGRTRL